MTPPPDPTMPETHDLPLDVIRKAWDENVKPGAQHDKAGSPWASFTCYGNEERAVKFARAILTAARESDAAARIAAQREAASRAWDAAMAWCGCTPNPYSRTASDRYLDREYPLPARECVLSDGSVVTYHAGRDCPWRREYAPGAATTVSARRAWQMLADTGADFEALKSFAAGVGR